MGHMRTHQQMQGDPQRDRGSFTGPAFAGNDKWEYLKHGVEYQQSVQRATSDHIKGKNQQPDYEENKRAYAESKADELIRDDANLVKIVEALLRTGKIADAYGVVCQYYIGRYGKRHKLLRGKEGVSTTEAVRQSDKAADMVNLVSKETQAVTGQHVNLPANPSTHIHKSGIGDPLIVLMIVTALIHKIQRSHRRGTKK